MTDSNSNYELTSLATQVVVAFVRNNHVIADELPSVIHIVYSAFQNLGKTVAPVQEERKPAVPVKKSVTPDYIVCLEDGKKMKMLKRHLRTTYDLSPEEYRARWGLPPDYPMVAPNYAAARSTLALAAGLGRKRVEAVVEAGPVKRKPGRPKKVA